MAENSNLSKTVKICILYWILRKICLYQHDFRVVCNYLDNLFEYFLSNLINYIILFMRKTVLLQGHHNTRLILDKDYFSTVLSNILSWADKCLDQICIMFINIIWISMASIQSKTRLIPKPMVIHQEKLKITSKTKIIDFTEFFRKFVFFFFAATLVIS